MSKGFTLIELLVVLLVLSLVAGVAVFSMGVFRGSDHLENATRALSSRLALAQMHVTFEQNAMGVEVQENGYRFYRQYAPDDHWELITDDSVFKAQSFPHHKSLTVVVDGKSQSLTAGTPQVIFQPGVMPQFSMAFKGNGDDAYQISVSPQGEIVWQAL